MEQEEIKKIQIINDFLEVNKIEKTSKIAIFNAIVEYVEMSICDVTKVHLKLDNICFGNIDVFETERIDINKVHTGFSLPYNEYQLSNQTLLIKGTANSAKGGENYTVKITPLK